MSFNLCDLPPAVWKERNGKLATAELDSSAFTGHQLEVFTKSLVKYRAKP
ncbi:hypothetical protein [Aeromonas hydrophila]